MTYAAELTCPEKAKHTPKPEGYGVKGERAERMSKTHNQRQCEGCGLYVIWVPKHGPRCDEVTP